jgi:hypothetical protein
VNHFILLRPRHDTERWRRLTSRQIGRFSDRPYGSIKRSRPNILEQAFANRNGKGAARHISGRNQRSALRRRHRGNGEKPYLHARRSMSHLISCVSCGTAQNVFAGKQVDFSQVEFSQVEFTQVDFRQVAWALLERTPARFLRCRKYLQPRGDLAIGGLRAAMTLQ